MNTQSISNNTIQSIIDRIDKLYLFESDKIFYEESYKINANLDLETLKKLYWLREILCNSNCQEEYYKKVIEKANLLLIKNERIQ